jgi:hypothetical protein
MVPRAPPVITPLPIFRADWKTLARLAFTPSKLLDLDVWPVPTSSVDFVAQPTNQGPNQETVAVILMPKLPNQSYRFWGPNRKTLHHLDFEAKPGETVDTSFEAKLAKTIAAGFEAKPLETFATGFEAKSVKTVWVVLRPNHSQTVDLGFEAEPRNPRS